MNLEAIKRLLDPLRQRIMLMVGRGQIQLIEESGGRVTAQANLLSGETADGLGLMQHYGFASSPRPDSEAVVLFVGGDRSQGFVVGTDDPWTRPLGLQPGEVAVFSWEDRLGDEEELPELPEGAPEGWPAMPETEESPLPALCRIHFLAGRKIRINANTLELFGLEGISLASPVILWGPPGMQTELPPASEGMGRMARVGDCVETNVDGTVYVGQIVESCG